MDRVQQLENLLPQYRGSFSGLLSLCTAYVYSEQFARAIALCEQAQQIDSLHPEPYKLIAAIYKIQGLHEKSAASLKALLQKQQEVGVQEDADALTFLGWSYAVQGAYAEAKAAYTQAHARLPGDADVAFNLALVYKQQGDDQKYKELLENAREFARRKIANDLQVAKSYFHLAKIYAHEKNWDQALLNLHMAISRNVDWCFWLKHESHFQDFFEVHPEFLRAIKVISDFYVGNKIQQTLVQLG